jgi:endonuclease/exonuclease/phosphatase family metal-dependent hydrolase
MNVAMDCVADNCSTTGDDQGQMTNLDCTVANCVGAVLPLLSGNEQQQQCFACAVTQLPSRILADIRTSCPSIPNQNLTYQGQNGVMILSRYPLSDVAEWVIPGTWTRRVIINATAKLPNGSELDIYCNHLTPIFSNPVFLYTGQYGGDAEANIEKWEAEQFLQAQKLIARVQSTSGDTPTVILGDLNTGLAFPDQTIIAEGPSTLELLQEEFPAAYTSDYVPQCTFCDTNPITGVAPGESVWIDHILLYNLSAESVVSTERTFDEDVVPVDTPEGPIAIPLSDHFGMRSVIEVP